MCLKSNKHTQPWYKTNKSDEIKSNNDILSPDRNASNTKVGLAQVNIMTS